MIVSNSERKPLSLYCDLMFIYISTGDTLLFSVISRIIGK